MSFRTLLIDDEQDCLELVKWQLEKYCPSMNVIAACNAAQEGLAAIEKMNPEVVFLDVEMPFMNGFELLHRVREINFEVIFTTAHDAYALKALKLNAVDYLLKPIVKDELVIAVEKVQQKLKKKQVDGRQATIASLHNLNQLSQKKIAIPVQDSILFLKIEDILYVESESNYSSIFVKNRKPIVAAKTLRHFEDLLSGHQFYRIHASFLINLSEVAEFKKADGGSVVMTNGMEVKISRSRKSEFLRLL